MTRSVEESAANVPTPRSRTRMPPGSWSVEAIQNDEGLNTFAVFADDAQLSEEFPTRGEAERELSRLAAIPECDYCATWGDPRCANPGHCESCGQLKFGTGRRERTCGNGECVKRCAG